MNILLGYEPYRGFEIYVFPSTGKDILGVSEDRYQGWAKRTSDGKHMDGSNANRTIAEAEEEMKYMIDAVLNQEERKAAGLSLSEPTPSAFFGFK